MTTLAFAPLHNSPGKKDATGAFQPESDSWIACRHDNGDADWAHVLVDNKLPSAKQRAAVLAAIGDHSADHIAFFCHGWKTGIQFGFGMQHLDTIAQTIMIALSHGFAWPWVSVALYACSTADGPGAGGDGGFADGLRDAFCRAGVTLCTVDAHDRPGHTSKNPYVRRFEGMGSKVGGTGGYWIVAPGSPLWKPWVKALRDTDLRFRFPSMSIAEIHDELRAGSHT